MRRLPYPANPITGFTLRVLFWLPLCFGAWYFATILIAVALATLLAGPLIWLLPDVVAGVVPRGNDLLVLLRVEALDPASQAVAPSGVMAHPVDAVKYGYGIPLYTALLLAAPGGESEKMARWLVGLVILLLVQWLGLSAEILKDLVFGLEAARAHLGASELSREILAIAYQLGYLILPSVTPVLVWSVQFRSYIRELAT
ncbi:hypothetical protein HW932_16915 [Allochromatium humboldtianum]|uniref:Uncharacterized protein n=1 Tax=Allochromatium humboldtianum TaxID=504901 RepID=A0A850RIL5_9GAMM|nr:exosortase H-associated membrane protein [Allochromatium humboldtianum]NVZ10942.1 hypothetical protein [Allochromatium humboldtianum]